MAKKYLDMNVYEATQKRLKYIFNEFDNVLVAFSGRQRQHNLFEFML